VHARDAVASEMPGDVRKARMSTECSSSEDHDDDRFPHRRAGTFGVVGVDGITLRNQLRPEMELRQCCHCCLLRNTAHVPEAQVMAVKAEVHLAISRQLPWR